MRIQNSEVLLTGSNAAMKEFSRSETLKVWAGSRRPDFESNAGHTPVWLRDIIDLSRQAKAAMRDIGSSPGVTPRVRNAAFRTVEDPVAQFLRILTELLTGKKIKITSTAPAADGIDPQKTAELSRVANQAQAGTPSQPQASTQSGFGLEYDSREISIEAESMNFAAFGTVRTADGQQINFNLQLSMARVFVSEKSSGVRLGDAVVQQDPLMINFGGTAAQLTDTKFSFDINSDGKDEQVSFAGANSGFITLDKNGDGKVTNGSELFGAASGNGFRYLAEYDRDKNGWIDDNDPVFSQLQVWMKDEQGNDSLVSLKSKNVGALFLGSAASPFELKDAGNGSLGTIRSSGVYLNEDGSVGTLQQVDLTL